MALRQIELIWIVTMFLTSNEPSEDLYKPIADLYTVPIEAI